MPDKQQLVLDDSGQKALYDSTEPRMQLGRRKSSWVRNRQPVEHNMPLSVCSMQRSQLERNMKLLREHSSSLLRRNLLELLLQLEANRQSI